MEHGEFGHEDGGGESGCFEKVVNRGSAGRDGREDFLLDRGEAGYRRAVTFLRGRRSGKERLLIVRESGWRRGFSTLSFGQERFANIAEVLKNVFEGFNKVGGAGFDKVVCTG